jgi:drug/metabolite transporter (DMT)-like permease
MLILGAITAAIGWGISDYAGGDTAQRDAPVFAIVAISEVLGVLLLMPFLVPQEDPIPASPRLVFAILAGFSVTFELGLIYRALSRGRALITAPVGALGAALAVMIGVAGGDPLNVTIVIGLLCALIGSAISSWSSTERIGLGGLRQSDAAICLAAAASVGITLTLLHAAGPLNAYSVTAVQHAGTAASAALAAAFVGLRSARRSAPQRQTLFTPRHLAGLLLIAIAGTAGDVGYMSASHRGALSIVAALASLYPLITILLGRVLRGHRATRIQLLGVVVALAGAVLLGAAAP